MLFIMLLGVGDSPRHWLIHSICRMNACTMFKTRYIDNNAIAINNDCGDFVMFNVPRSKHHLNNSM